MSEEFQVWKQHFINQAKGLIPHQKRFYKVSMQHGAGVQPTIKLISPTEQIVDRAKASLEQPPTIYDPVTGAMQQTSGKHIKTTTPRKRKRKATTKKNHKKRKVIKSTKTKKKSKSKSKSKKQKWV